MRASDRAEARLQSPKRRLHTKPLLEKRSVRRLIWQILLRTKSDVSFRYVQTQRHARVPSIGEILPVRKIDGVSISTTVQSATIEGRGRAARWGVQVGE